MARTSDSGSSREPHAAAGLEYTAELTALCEAVVRGGQYNGSSINYLPERDPFAHLLRAIALKGPVLAAAKQATQGLLGGSGSGSGNDSGGNTVELVPPGQTHRDSPLS